VKDGRKGLDHWRGLLAENGEDPDETFGSAVAKTTSGGRHYWFQRPADYEGGCRSGDGRNTWLPDVDLKTGPGGYVVATPSRTRDGAYEWIGGSVDELPLPPAWLVETAQKRAPTKRSMRRGEGTEPLGMAPGRARTPEETLEIIERCLERLGAEDFVPRDSWKDVGMIIHDATNASEEGFAAWDAWSSKCEEKYDAVDTRRVWNSFTVGGGLTLGSLIHWAGLAGDVALASSVPNDERKPGPAGIDVEIIRVSKTRRTTKLLLRVTRDGTDRGETPCSMSAHGLNECAKAICGLAEINERENWKRVKTWLSQRRLRSESIAAAQRRIAASCKSAQVDDVAARALLDAYGVRFQTPIGTWWLEKDGRAHEEWPQHLLGTCPGQVLDAVVEAGLAGDLEEAHSLYKNKKDIVAYRARELVPDELGVTELDPQSLRARTFRETLMRRLLAPSEFWPKNISSRFGERCGPAHPGTRSVPKVRAAEIVVFDLTRPT